MNDPASGQQPPPQPPRPGAATSGRTGPQPTGSGWLVFKIILWIVGGLAALGLLAIGLFIGTCFLR